MVRMRIIAREKEREKERKRNSSKARARARQEMTLLTSPHDPRVITHSRKRRFNTITMENFTTIIAIEE